MNKVDFGYVGKNKCTIYNQCFDSYVNSRFIQERSKADMTNLLAATEIVFEFLVEEGNKLGFNIDSILENPTTSGSTCFFLASQFSKKIMNYILDREIKVNSITADMSNALSNNHNHKTHLSAYASYICQCDP